MKRGLLYWAVIKYHKLIKTLSDAGINHGLDDAYVKVNRSTARRVFIVIGEVLFFDRKTQIGELEELLRELLDFLRTTAPRIVDPVLFETLRSHYYETLSLVRRGNLFEAVYTYRSLIQLLLNSGIRHNLRYTYVRSTMYRYKLTHQGDIVSTC